MSIFCVESFSVYLSARCVSAWILNAFKIIL